MNSDLHFITQEDARRTYLIYEKDQSAHIARITMNRPEKLNAWPPEGARELVPVLDDVEQDDTIKVVILRGAGKAFCTGVDLGMVGSQYGWDPAKHPGEKPPRPSVRRRLVADKVSSRLFARLFYCQKVTIASVQGYCLGGGFDWFMSCDLSVVTEDARFGHPGRRIVGPANGLNMILWFTKLGPTLCHELMYTGRQLTAPEALQHHVVNKMVSMDKLEQETNTLAKTVALMPADGIVMAKSNMQLYRDIMGMNAGYSFGYIAHTLGTNIRYEPDELNFLKERRDKGARQAFHERDERFARAAEDGQT